MKLKKIKVEYLIIPSIILLAFPFFVFAQFTSGVIECESGSYSLIGGDFKCTISRIIDLIKLLVPVLFGLAFLAFFWGLSKFILNSGNSIELQKGKSYMFWGILALFILISVRAIVFVISSDMFGTPTGFIPLLKR